MHGMQISNTPVERDMADAATRVTTISAGVTSKLGELLRAHRCGHTGSTVTGRTKIDCIAQHLPGMGNGADLW